MAKVVAKGQVFGAAAEGLHKYKGRRCISGRSEFAICALDDGLIFLGGRHRVSVTVLSSHASLRSSYQQLIFQTRFIVKNCSLISSASLLSSVRGAVGRRA